MKNKRLEQSDLDAQDEEEEPTKRPRTRFVTLQPGGDDPADAIDDEIPGSVPADVEPLVLEDTPFDPYPPGDERLSSAHLASDPGWARAQRKLLRTREQDQQAMAAVAEGEERYDQPEEQYNEAGDTVEPFHLNKEREEGYIDAAGTYIEFERPDEAGDAWLESIEDQVVGTKGDAGDSLPYPNEPVELNLPPLPATDLGHYRRVLMEALQPGEAVSTALRRLAGAGQVLEKFENKGEAQKVWRERMHSGRTVAPGNQPLFEQVTEAAEVLFDHGNSNIYSATREHIQEEIEREAQQERAPPQAAPPPAAAAAAAAAVEDAEAPERHAAAPAVAGAGAGRGSADGRAMRGERQPAAAAAALPAEGMPSVPAAEQEARGPGQEGAVHGFAAELVEDLLEEAPVSAPPPQEVEAGLGLPFASPTAVEYQQKAAAGEGGASTAANSHQRLKAEAAAGEPSPMKAALFGTFSHTEVQRREG